MQFWSTHCLVIFDCTFGSHCTFGSQKYLIELFSTMNYLLCTLSFFLKNPDKKYKIYLKACLIRRTEIKWNVDNFWPSWICTLIQSVSGVCWVEIIWTCFPHWPTFSSSAKYDHKVTIMSNLHFRSMIISWSATKNHYFQSIWNWSLSETYSVQSSWLWFQELTKTSGGHQVLNFLRQSLQIISENQFLIKSIHHFYILLLHPIRMELGNDNAHRTLWLDQPRR